ncbi:MAG TPA: MlaD family protein [Actinomycetota bacterium]|nr:MlaD family protein [Actinomycetota bacterium]
MRRVAAIALIAAVASAACGFGGDGAVTVRARFDDIGDLAPAAPVMTSDVQIGRVDAIELDGDRALVTMSIDEEAAVPRGVIARIRRTSLLGERIVDLYIPPELPPSAPPLEDGDVIAMTETRADLEDLVIEGVDVLGPIAASEIATLVEEGARGFGGHGKDLRILLRNFEEIVRGYAARTDDIRGVIVSLGRFNSVLASRAVEQARSLENSAQAMSVLSEEVDRLERAIRALDRLAVGARGILTAHSDEMDRFFRQMRVILRVLRDEEDSLVKILRWAPLHNQNTQLTEYKRFVQVYQDFIICGLNEDPDDPARSCEGIPE